MMDSMEALLKPEQVAEKLQLHISTVYHFAHRGILPCVKLGKAVRFRPEALEKLIKHLEERAVGNAA